jgi:DNA-binding LacI/PurR family transcriptional regulator
MKRPTLVEIARLAGVSHVTVSMALRNSSRISAATRTRVQAIAQEIGYRPDPMLSALVSYRRQIKPPGYQATLAWINTYRPASQLLANHLNYWEGARTRARELGYELEEFRLVDCKGQTELLSKILRARNIKGLLLAPQQRGRAHLKMDFENFSVVALGFTLVHPQFHVVTTAQYRCGVLAMRSLRALGYRRIGCVLTRNYDERTDHNFSASFLREQWRFHRREAVSLLISADRAGAEEKRHFTKWYRKYAPEVILTHHSSVPSWLESLKDKGEKCPVILLNTASLKQPGIIQNENLVGRTAVETLVSMLHRNECGVPATPLRLLVEGRWNNASQIPRLCREKMDPPPRKSIRPASLAGK